MEPRGPTECIPSSIESLTAFMESLISQTGGFITEKQTVALMEGLLSVRKELILSEPKISSSCGKECGACFVTSNALPCTNLPWC